MKHDNYDDIIDLPHHVSGRHPQMTMEQRAAQFAPFAALEEDIVTNGEVRNPGEDLIVNP